MAAENKYDAGGEKWHAKSILSLRKHLAMTQAEMADKLGTRQQTISEWEKGMYRPRGASAKLLSIVAESTRFKYDARGSSPSPPLDPSLRSG